MSTFLPKSGRPGEHFAPPIPFPGWLSRTLTKKINKVKKEIQLLVTMSQLTSEMVGNLVVKSLNFHLRQL